MNLARRAHQTPGCLVDEDGLRGFPSSRTAGSSGSGRRGLPCMGACSPRGTASQLQLSTEGGRLASFPPNPLLVSSSLLSLIICTEVTLAVQQQHHHPWPAGVTAGPGRLASCLSLHGLFATVLATVRDEYWGMRQKIEVCAQNCSISLQLQVAKRPPFCP